MAETRENAGKRFDLFIKTHQLKYPIATQCLKKEQEKLLAFYEFPADHWAHIRTTNPIESTFSTIRLRTKKNRACVSRAAIPDYGLQTWIGARPSQLHSLQKLFRKLIQDYFCYQLTKSSITLKAIMSTTIIKEKTKFFSSFVYWKHGAKIFNGKIFQHSEASIMYWNIPNV